MGYDERSLQGLDNYQLVRVALEPKPGNKFASPGWYGTSSKPAIPPSQCRWPRSCRPEIGLAPDRLSNMSIQGQRAGHHR